MIKKLPKVIQFQAVEPGFEPKPLGFEVRSVNCDTIQSYNDEVQKADRSALALELRSIIEQ